MVYRDGCLQWFDHLCETKVEFIFRYKNTALYQEENTLDHYGTLVFYSQTYLISAFSKSNAHS